MQRFWQWLFRPRQSKYFTGLIDDPRPEGQKKFDFLHEEQVMTYPTGGIFTHPKITMSPYPDEDQKQVGSCVPHGVGRALAIERESGVTSPYTRLAWEFVYRLRSIYPAPGSWLQDIFQIYSNIGAPLYTTLPDVVTEDEASALTITAQARLEAAIYKGKTYMQLAVPNNIDTLASIAEAHAVPIILFSTYDEWAREYPIIQDPSLTADYAEVRHCVCILPNSSFIENGKRYVTIQDSSHFGGITLRHVSEDFITARVYGAGYWTSVATLGIGPRPIHAFTKVLTQGMRNSEVVWMQKLFISEGFLPADCASGYFGGMTLAALHAFQNKYASDILLPIHLDAPTDTFGARCIAKANTLCV